MAKTLQHQKANDPTSPSVDPRIINQALVDLHIARRNLLIYPVTHKQVKRSVVRSFKSLLKMFQTESRVTLAVMKESLAVGGQALGTKNSALIDLAGVLKRYGIATITITKGVEIKELFRFLQLICVDREKIIAKGGIVTAAGERNLPSIQIQAVDYSKLRLTEEEAIHRSSGDESPRKSVWQQFVSDIMKGESIQGNSNNLRIDPGRLADLLNYKVVEVQRVVEQFQKSFCGTLSSGAGQQSSTEELLAFQQMIKGLNPELKHQFLAVTFDNCSQTNSNADIASLVDGLGVDLLIQMLRQASSQGKKISPSLLAFIQKMNLADAPGAIIPANGKGASPSGLSSEKVESLLSHEQYETYVDSDYQQLLGHLTRNSQYTDKASLEMTLSEEVEEGLKGEGILTHVGRALTRLMDQSGDISGFRDWARQLSYLLDELLESHAYGYLTRVIEYIRSRKKGADKARAEIAGLVLDRFSDPLFVAKAIESVHSFDGEDEQDALVFFMELGEPVVAEIFDGLDPQQTFKEQGVLNQLLGNLRSLTTKEALRRIKDPRPDYVRRMVRIIGKIGDSQSVLQIKSLMDHPAQQVRMEALATLLKFDNKWGSVRLRELLSDPQGEDFIEAAALAGEYRKQSVVPQLGRIAGQRGEMEIREAAIRALGQIKDPKAVPILETLVRRRWFMAKKQSRYLKRVVFDTLGGYPRDAVQSLLRFGFKQKDPEIRSICRRLLRKGSDAQRHD